LGIIRGIIGTYFNGQINKIVNADAADRGLKVTGITTLESIPEGIRVRDEQEYHKKIDCIDKITKEQKCFHVKIIINADRQAALEWSGVLFNTKPSSAQNCLPHGQ
jgi:hypothetical protein